MIHVEDGELEFRGSCKAVEVVLEAAFSDKGEDEDGETES